MEHFSLCIFVLFWATKLQNLVKCKYWRMAVFQFAYYFRKCELRRFAFKHEPMSNYLLVISTGSYLSKQLICTIISHLTRQQFSFMWLCIEHLFCSDSCACTHLEQRPFFLKKSAQLSQICMRYIFKVLIFYSTGVNGMKVNTVSSQVSTLLIFLCLLLPYSFHYIKELSNTLSLLFQHL